MNSMKPIPGLGPLETAVMLAVWKAPPATVREIQQSLGGSHAYTTVMTTMARLHRKGLLSRKLEGTAFRYTAKVDRGGWLQRWSRTVIESLMPSLDEGSVAYFVSEANKTSPELLAALRRALQERE